MSYIVGNTVRLQATFKDVDGNVTDVDAVSVKIYDNTMTILVEDTPTRSETGVYYYDHVLTGDDYAYEFYGEIDSLPSLNRESLTVSGRL